MLATIVVLGHFGAPPLFNWIGRDWFPGHAFLVLYENMFSGPAAVVVFFVISGFCIHYPFRRENPPSLLAFYARRNVRIVLPAAAAVLLAHLVGVTIDFFGNSILWSLICEEIYYLLYPALRLAAKLASWRALAILSAVPSTLVVVLHPHAENYPSYGNGLNWVLGLPCWLIGCALAERLSESGDSFPVPQRSVRHFWRISLVLLATLTSILRFHTPLTYPWTLNLFALFSSFWLESEIGLAIAQGPSKVDPLGRMSYSLYLFHVPAHAVLGMLVIPSLGILLNWSADMLAIFALCAVFFFLVELPSHRLARRISRRVGRRSPAGRPGGRSRGGSP